LEIVVINLKRELSKRVRAERILINTGLRFSFFEAVDGKLLDKEYVNLIQNQGTKLFEKRGSYMSESEIGLYLSHIQIIKYFLDSDAEFICIFEDDFMLADEFKLIFENNILKKLSDFDVLMLGHFLDNKKYGVITKFNFSKNRLNIPLEFNYGAHAYILNRKSAQYILNNFSIPLCPFDHILGILEIYGLNRMIVSPPIVYQDEAFESSVQSNKFNSNTGPIFLIKRISKYLLYNLFPRIAMKHLLRHKII